MTDDPTRIRSQPSLTTSSGRVWLVVGGLFALVALAVLVPMTALPPPGLALVGAIGVIALYLAMVATRIFAPSGRLRLALLASAMLGMAALALVVVAIVAAAAWEPVR
jgi:hypothetical protein